MNAEQTSCKKTSRCLQFISLQEMEITDVMDSFMGLNILNCNSRYKISLNNILNLRFQSNDSYSYFRAIVGSSALLSPLIELLQCRDGS